jgi:hypothetical protein
LFDDDLRFLEAVKDFAVEQPVAKVLLRDPVVWLCRSGPRKDRESTPEAI